MNLIADTPTGSLAGFGKPLHGEKGKEKEGREGK